MSYTPTNWLTGDTITAEKLNNMESGISANDTMNEPLVVTLTPTAQDFSGTMDKTPTEIKTAYEQGSRIRFEIPSLYAAVDATQYIVMADRMQVAANITYEVLGIGDVLIQVITSSTDSTYTTKIFPLTPMS